MRTLVLILALLAVTPLAHGQSLSDMTSPEVDDPGKEWCFLAKSTTVIGMPYQPDVTQVTYDGALYTRHAELCFFYGKDRRPMFARQKTFLDGWLPLVEYGWREGSLRYHYEAFAQSLPGEDASNTVNFVKIQIKNEGKKLADGLLVSALRHKLDDSRFGGMPYTANISIRNDLSAVYESDSLIYQFANHDLAEPTQSSSAVRSANEVFSTTKYRRSLMPGESVDFEFKMPRVPVSGQFQKAFLAKLVDADYERMRKETINYWKRAVIGNTEFRIPEARVQNALRASLVHMLLATRERDGKRFQTDGLPYPDLFLTSNVQAEMAYDFLGRPHDYEGSLKEVLSRQNAGGIFMDTSLPQNEEPLIAAQGQTLHALSYHFILTHDEAFAKRVFPAIARGITWMRNAQRKDKYGLMPQSWPYDNEMILGRYTSHNLWCLLGLRSAIRMARDLGETELASEWAAFEAEYASSIVKALHASALPDGSVPPGLYDYKTGNEARAGFKDYQTNQDWENMLLATPSEVLTPDDPILTATLQRLHETKFREGVMTYRNGQHLHQYITTNVMEQEMARGDQEQALIDLYHVLLHCGPTYEGFENLVEPWTRQVNPDCPPPHAWAAMKTALVIRNALIVERGGKAGMKEDQRELHLFSLLSPCWVRPGSSIGFKNAPCEMGKVTALMEFTTYGADLSILPEWSRKPKAIVVHIPWFVDSVSYTTDENSVIPTWKTVDALGLKGIRLDPSTDHLRIRWRIRPNSSKNTLQKLLLTYRREPGFKMVHGEGVATPGHEGTLSPAERKLPPVPLSFAAVLQAFNMEYRRRFDQFMTSGGTPIVVQPVGLDNKPDSARP